MHKWSHSLYNYLIPQAIQQELLFPNSVELVQRITSGLSGAMIWRGISVHGPVALRCWPKAHPSYERLLAIHFAMQEARAAELDFVPSLYRNREGQSITRDGMRLWELTQWCAGVADYGDYPSGPRLQAAMHALAQLHNAWSRSSSALAVSPTVIDRSQRLEAWCKSLPRLTNQPRADAQMRMLADDTLRQLAIQGPRHLEALNSIAAEPVATHFVLRDIWSEHVLFTDEKVTGMIDFGAARVDEPATDVARLLGSLEPIDQQRWCAGLEYYLRSNPAVNRHRVQILGNAATLLSALQWLEWLVLEPREFETSRPKLLARWRGLLNRLSLLPKI